MNLTADDLLAMRAGEMNTGLGGLASSLEREREREQEGGRKGGGEKRESVCVGGGEGGKETGL